LVPTTGNVGPPVGPIRPAFTSKDTDFWAQGVNFGLELRF
jgi:putative beta barrel porin BBP7